MKKLPHIKFWLFYLTVGIMAIFSVFLYWFVYLFREQIRTKKEWSYFWGFFWLMLNDDELNKNGYNDFGAEWWLKREKANVNDNSNYYKKLFYAYRWSVFRNPAYNLQLLYKPLKGKKENVIKVVNYPDNHSIWTWRNKEIKGKQYVKWTVNGVKYFRYSFTNSWLNVMYGYGEIKMILKIRLWLY